MEPGRLQDRVHWGLNVAARAIGVDTDAYRPSGLANPMALANRFLRLHAAFTAPDGRFAHPARYGDSLWYGIFDAAYTRPGDYLVQEGSTWFVAAQQRLLPVLCVLTNRTVSFARPAAASKAGINDYGGTTRATDTPLLTAWPASVLGISGKGRPSAELPADSSSPLWTVLLPAFPGIILRPSDVLTDDLKRIAIVTAAELTEFGWRVTAKQAMS